MCGLVGVYGDLYFDHLKFFKQALIADYMRGKHSTGMTAVKASGDVFNKKLAIDPITFLDLKSVDENILNSNTLIMGHNRHATQGAINATNAHPFEHGDITLMHNGTLTNKVALQSEYDAPVFGTDSELVCWLLNEHDVATIIPKLKGAFALTWYDAGENTFNFIRNDERPMAMALDGGVLLYASEWRMLGWLMERNKLTIKDFDVFEPKAGEHYKFSYSKKVITKEVTEIDLYVEPPYVAPNYGNNYMHQYPATSGYVGGRGGVDDRFKMHRETFGGKVFKNDIVYAYVDKVATRAHNKDTHFDLECSLVNSPYTVCKVFFLPYAKYPEIDKAFVVRAKVTSCYNSGGEPYFLIDPDFEVINEVSDKWYTEYEQVVRDDGQIVDTIDPDDSKDETGIVMIGADKTLITTKEFRTATESGCCVCRGEINAEKEIDEEQTCMVVSHASAVCEHCIDVYENCLQMGYV